MAKPSNSLSLSLESASVVTRLKEGYLAWIALVVPHMPKTSRYTLGVRIEERFLDLLELLTQAYFSPSAEKLPKVNQAITALDTLKFLVSVAWEAKLLSHTHYEQVAGKLDETGKMLGGWKKNLTSPDKKTRHTT